MSAVETSIRESTPMRLSSSDSEERDQVSRKDPSKRRVRIHSIYASAQNIRKSTSMLVDRWTPS